MKKIAGSCMCGAVRYEIQGNLRDIIGCHCTLCRKSSGHFTAATATDPEHLLLLSDTELTWHRSSPLAQRGFCRQCGSTLFWKPDSGTHISIFAGSIDGPTGLSLSSHICLEEKGDYYRVES